MTSMVLPGLLLLALVIFAHELGHFRMAKWRGVRVLRFSLGFGPALLKWTRGETEYRLSVVPLGGYVQMAGDSPGEDGTMPGGPDEFLSHSWFGRILIAAAGPAANLITAFLVLVTIGLVGVSYPDHPNVVGAIADTSLAYRLCVRPGDRITAVSGTPVKSWIEILLAADKPDKSQTLSLHVEREHTALDVPIPANDRVPFFSSLRRISDPPIVGSVATGMPAYKSGLKEGDRILAVDHTAVRVFEDLPAAFRGKVDKPVVLTVLRNGKVFELKVTPMNPDGRRGGRDALIGIEAPRHSVYVERHPLGESLQMGFYATGALVANVYGGMWLTISHPLYYREYLGGPLFIAQAASGQAKRGLDSYLNFLAMITVAIMAFNLLPTPILDGGHILLALLQAFRRQALSARAYIRFQKIGLAVIGTLFILILANDPLRWVQRQRALDKTPQEGEVAPSPP